ncbi:hypothetical protein WP3W18E02_08660 [Klebsiella sp. WP3-W18-ESBL-02]|nr:hypothetical protein WP3W18E02_08660 [Klebsiella sp. WP3-W18-ESBL-02]
MSNNIKFGKRVISEIIHRPFSNVHNLILSKDEGNSRL